MGEIEIKVSLPALSNDGFVLLFTVSGRSVLFLTEYLTVSKASPMQLVRSKLVNMINNIFNVNLSTELSRPITYNVFALSNGLI